MGLPDPTPTKNKNEQDKKKKKKKSPLTKWNPHPHQTAFREDEYQTVRKTSSCRLDGAPHLLSSKGGFDLWGATGVRNGNVGVGSRVFRFHGQEEGCALVQ